MPPVAGGVLSKADYLRGAHRVKPYLFGDQAEVVAQPCRKWARTTRGKSMFGSNKIALLDRFFRCIAEGRLQLGERVYQLDRSSWVVITSTA